MTYNIDLSNIKDLMTPKGYAMLKMEDRYLVSYGGSGSSKSYSATQKILFRVLTEPKHRFLCVRRTAKSLKKSVYQQIIDVIEEWGVKELFTINKTDLTITCKNGSVIYFTGMDDPEKIKSISSITGLWVEEASEITLDSFTQLDLRLRGNTKSYKQIILTFNPVSSKSWLKKRFFDNLDPLAKIVHSTYKNNPYIDKRYIDILESLISQNPSYYKIYALGEFGVLKGLIYPDYELIDNLPEDYEFKTYGLDFGFNHPQVLIETRTIKNDIYIKEIFYKSQSLVDDLISAMKEEKISENSLIYADSANPDKIVMIQNAGFTKCTQAKKDVLAGIDFVKSKKIHITKCSTNLIKEIESYSWKLDKNGEPEEKPVKFLDDGMDALRYSIFRGERITTSISSITSRRSDYNYDGFDDKDLYTRDNKKDTFGGY